MVTVIDVILIHMYIYIYTYRYVYIMCIYWSTMGQHLLCGLILRPVCIVPQNHLPWRDLAWCLVQRMNLTWIYDLN